MNRAPPRARESRGQNLSASYFASPLRTLSESLEDPERLYIADHDLVEAYRVLASRIRSQQDALCGTHPPSCVSIFREYSSRLERCLLRDIQCCLPNLYDTQPQSHGDSMPYSFDINVIQDDEDPHNFDRRHNLGLCALQLMSDLFMYRSLYSTFSSVQIAGLFQKAVLLCERDSFNVRGARSRWLAVLHMLGNQRLPAEFLHSEVHGILRAIKVAIGDDTRVYGGQPEVFWVVGNLLGKYPILVAPFLDVFQPVLVSLNHEELEIRICAAFALSGFAEARLRSLASSHFPHTQLKDELEKYLKTQRPRGRTADHPDILPAIVRSAAEGHEYWKGEGQSFAVSVASMLAFLLDHHLFSNGETLKVVFFVLTEAARHSWRGVHPEVWKILLWCFSRMHPPKQDEEKAKFLDQRRRVLLTVGQDVKNGIGIALVRLLLPLSRNGEPLEGDMDKAIDVVKDMAMSNIVGTRQDATLVMQRLMSRIGASMADEARGVENSTEDVIFARCLVNGRLLGETRKNLVVPKTPTRILDIRPLDQAEIVEYWDALLGICSTILQRFLLEGEQDLPENIVQIWQALLLAPCDLTESHQHITASASVASKIATVVTGLTPPLETPATQARYLSAIFKLWKTLKHVFTPKWLSSPAERILASVLKRQFDLGDERVKELWSQLCADLVAIGVPSLLHVLHTRSLSPSQEGREVTRNLWRFMASPREPNESMEHMQNDWMDLVHLMAMPFSAWEMDKHELDIWIALFDRAVQLATDAGLPTSSVASLFLELLPESKIASLQTVPQVISSLLPRLSGATMSQGLKRLLPVLNNLFITSYSAATYTMAEAKLVLTFVESVISGATSADIVDILSCLRTSLCRWIADDENLLPVDEHITLVNALYVEGLNKLSLVEPSLDHLNILANYLQSAFIRPQPAAVVAFQDFWRSTYHKCQTIAKKDYPLPIKACLKAWSDVCNDSLADELSLASGSQSLESYTIPDSQPSSSPYRGQFSEILDLSMFAGPSFLPDAPQNGVGEEESDAASTPTIKKSKVAPRRDTHSITRRRRRHSPLDDGFEQARLSGVEWSRSISKRFLEEDAPRTPKRMRNVSDIFDDGRDTARVKTFLELSDSHPSLSERVARAPSSSRSHPVGHLEPRNTGKRQREESPNWVGRDIKKPRRHAAFWEVEEAGHPSKAPSPDDYDSWERVVLTGDPEHSDVPDQYNDIPGLDPTSEVLLSPSLGDYPPRSRRRERSQTAPEPSTALESESVSIPQATRPLRRNRSSPLQRGSSIAVDLLEEAHAAWCGQGPSQIGVEDLMRARRIANQIHQRLDEEMAMKFNVQAHQHEPR